MIIPDLSLEECYWQKGIVHVAGVDEVGRGPLAGPVVAAAVVVHAQSQVVRQVRDSKKMSLFQREKAYQEIVEKSSAYGLGDASALEVDQLGIAQAVQKAMMSALAMIEKNFKLSVEMVIIDGARIRPPGEYPCQRIKAGDVYHYSISAASVLAKVTRDRLMRDWAQKYPQYGFEKHVGYGTKAHFEALAAYGPCPIHRQSFLKRKFSQPGDEESLHS